MPLWPGFRPRPSVRLGTLAGFEGRFTVAIERKSGKGKGLGMGTKEGNEGIGREGMKRSPSLALSSHNRISATDRLPIYIKHLR